MPQLQNLQKQFIDVIKGKDPADFVNEIVSQGSVSTNTRIKIYCNAYYLRLKECMETDHEVLGLYLGDDLFDQMVADYIQHYPSQHTSLRYFCDQLPTFLTQISPFDQHPVLSEIARFERYLLTAFDAADAPVATVEMLKQINPEYWPYIQFRLHPSVQRLHADYNCVDIWQSLKQKETPPAVIQNKNSWLIWRNAERLTEFVSLDICAYIMLEGIIAGNDYATLCEQLIEYIPEEDVSASSVQCLLSWLNQGIISSFSIDNSQTLNP